LFVLPILIGHVFVYMRVNCCVCLFVW